MAFDMNKENIADGLMDLSALKPAPKPGKKGRSVSMGPGALMAALKEDAGNRRKSAIVPAMKSILSSNEDEAKRKAERRKSLANRRVSFAPEATLHTWDVVEYIRDATTSSSASSESNTRHGGVSQLQNGEQDPPSTPAEEISQMELPSALPAENTQQQRKTRQRRSSGVPPMNFNNPEDLLSSSPSEDGSPLVQDGSENSSESGSEGVGEATMDLTGRSVVSPGFDGEGEDSTSSSNARLDEALRQATIRAGAQAAEASEKGNGFASMALEGEDDTQDVSMEMATAEITHAFQSFVRNKKPRDSMGMQKRLAIHDQENVDPFRDAPAGNAVRMEPVGTGEDDTMDMDMSMDMTNVIGGIIYQQRNEPSGQENEQTTKSLKRRRSSLNIANSAGSPHKRPSTRRSMRRASAITGSIPEDTTADFSLAIPGQGNSTTRTIPEIGDTSMENITMDLTMPMGSIQSSAEPSTQHTSFNANTSALEDLSMELTENLGKLAPPAPSPRKAAQSPVKSPAKSPGRGRSPRKSLGPNEWAAAQKELQLATPTKSSPSKSPRKSPRKSLHPSFQPSESIALTNAQKTNADPPALSSKLSDFSLPGDDVQIAASTATSQTTTPDQTESKSLSESIQLMATPRKQAIHSNPTPKKTLTPRAETSHPSTPPKQITPKQPGTPSRPASIRKSVRMNVPLPPREMSASPRKSPRKSPVKSPQKLQASNASGLEVAGEAEDDEEEPVPRIALPEFLKLINIKFMDLTTTKRRATGHPGSSGPKFRLSTGSLADDDVSLANTVVAAVETVPMLSMLQHSCNEMKSYLQSGKTEVALLSEAALDAPPPLFVEYLSAPPAERAIMDAQFRDLKTNARLQSKAGWYAWRSQLLTDLKTGLLATDADLAADDAVLCGVEEAVGGVVPELMEREEELQTKKTRLESRRAEVERGEDQELHVAREKLLAVEAEIATKRAQLEQMAAQQHETSARIDEARSWKEELTAEIEHAERVAEECRGWSPAEVRHLRNRYSALCESAGGWAVVGIQAEDVTLKHPDAGLVLTLQPACFVTRNRSPPPDAANGPISLALAAPEHDCLRDEDHDDPTVRRFFLQLLQAHVHSVLQCATRIPTLLRTLSAAWTLRSRLAAARTWLSRANVVRCAICGDERVLLETDVVLREVRTKVRVGFEVRIGVGPEGGVGAEVDTRVRVVYGEKYDEAKMGEFVATFVKGGLGEVRRWAEGVEDLRGRLGRRGRKGVRVL